MDMERVILHWVRFKNKVISKANVLGHTEGSMKMTSRTLEPFFGIYAKFLDF